MLFGLIFLPFQNFPEFSNVLLIYGNKSISKQKRFYLKVMPHYNIVMPPKDEDGNANSEDPDQIATLCSLIWICTVCPDLSVRKLRKIAINYVDERMWM